MAWTNHDLVLYHGCTDQAARSIIQNGINVNLCRPLVDFGRGFYTTTRLDQAQNWANAQYVRNKKSGQVGCAEVLVFDVPREAMAQIHGLHFVIEGSPTPPRSDFWELVRHCRGIHHADHQRQVGVDFYDFVSGPVALPHQGLIVKDCDQFSFHTANGIAALGPARSHGQGNATF